MKSQSLWIAKPGNPMGLPKEKAATWRAKRRH
jgi:hypothetical protein